MRVPSGAPAAPAEWPAANLPRASRIPRTHTHEHTHTQPYTHTGCVAAKLAVAVFTASSQRSCLLCLCFLLSLYLPLPPSPACPLPRLLHAAVFQCASNLGAVPRKLLQQTCRRCRRAADKLRQRGVYAMRLLAAQIKYTPHTATATCNRMHNKQIARHHYRKRRKPR